MSYISFCQSVYDRATTLRNPNDIATFLRDLARDTKGRSLLEVLCKALRSTPEALSSLATLSYCHENSFIKLMLVVGKHDEFRLRLHYWEPEEGQPLLQSNVHNHRFALGSLILAGALRNVKWLVAPDGEAYSHYWYIPRAGSSSYLLEYKGREQLKASRAEAFQQHAFYYQQAEELHTTDLLVSPLITLFVEDRSHLRPIADVYSQRYTPSNVVLDSPSLSPDEYLAQLETVDRLLRSGHAHDFRCA